MQANMAISALRIELITILLRSIPSLGTRSLSSNFATGCPGVLTPHQRHFLTFIRL